MVVLSIMILILIAVCWSLFWKGWALWVAGNRKEKVWFIVLFLINTLGILDIIYLYIKRNSKKNLRKK
jgi:divalent metal cation (Fe/Co/Zn/Cd) transporter